MVQRYIIGETRIFIETLAKINERYGFYFPDLIKEVAETGKPGWGNLRKRMQEKDVNYNHFMFGKTNEDDLYYVVCTYDGLSGQWKRTYVTSDMDEFKNEIEQTYDYCTFERIY